MRYYGARALAVLAVFLMVGTAYAESAAEEQMEQIYGKPASTSLNKLVAGVRLHTEIEKMTDLPIEKNDLSYGLMYEYHEGIGLWQIGADYVPRSSDNRFDSIVTPCINLILKDRIYRLGFGALKSWVDTDNGSDWTDIYWQIIAGLGIPLGSRFSFDIYGHYVFKKWDKFTDSDYAGFEYSALLGVSF